MNGQVILRQGGKERLNMRRLFRCHRLAETAFPFRNRWSKGSRTGSFGCQFSRRNPMVRWAVEGAPLSGGWAIGGRRFAPGHCPRWAGGGAAGLGAGLLRAQGSGSVDWMERRTAGGAAQVDRTKSAFSAAHSQGAGAQSGLPSFGSGLAGVAGAVAGSLWLHSAFGRELHRSGGLCGDLLQGQRLGSGRLQRRLQPPSGRFLPAQ